VAPDDVRLIARDPYDPPAPLVNKALEVIPLMAKKNVI